LGIADAFVLHFQHRSGVEMVQQYFISYRRHDSQRRAHQIYDVLRRHFDRDQVFMDVDTIPSGADFVAFLEGWIEQSSVVLALIGPSWIEAQDPRTGQRRLDDENDFVRIELRKALQRDIPVIPVLLDGAVMPRADQLPADLTALATKNAVLINQRTIEVDSAQLIHNLRFVEIGVSVGAPTPAFTRKIRPGLGRSEWFNDHVLGPQMVVVPFGEASEGPTDDAPTRRARVRAPLAVGRFPITGSQFEHFINASGHKTSVGAFVLVDGEWKLISDADYRTPGFDQDGSHPVVCVSWREADEYARWLCSITGRSYRLLFEHEWEHAARADTTTVYWNGNEISPSDANFGARRALEQRSPLTWQHTGTSAVGSYRPNPWGLYDIHGNVWEWCQDDWRGDFEAEYPDRAARTKAHKEGIKVIRGGSWWSEPEHLTSSFRYWSISSDRSSILGFRVARDL
jgi:formylglycine-generating enzyme required for sulfatase activity